MTPVYDPPSGDAEKEPREADSTRSGPGPFKYVCHYCRAELGYPVRELFNGFFTCGNHPEEQAESQQMERRARQSFIEKHPRFELNRPCPKCGNEHRTAEHHGGRHWRSHSIVQRQHSCTYETFPHMLRICGVCGNEETEVPLDFEVES